MQLKKNQFDDCENRLINLIKIGALSAAIVLFFELFLKWFTAVEAVIKNVVKLQAGYEVSQDPHFQILGWSHIKQIPKFTYLVPWAYAVIKGSASAASID